MPQRCEQIEIGLSALREALGPTEAMQVLVAHPAIRDRELAAVLAQEAEGATDPVIREHREHQSGYLRDVCDVLVSAANVGSLSALLALYISHPEVVGQGFWELLASENEIRTGAPYSKVLAAREELDALCELVNRLRTLTPEERVEVFESHSMLCAPLFHEWMASQAAHALKFGDVARVGAFVAVRDAVMSACRSVRGMQVRPSRDRGHRLVVGPSNEMMAEFWWYGYSHLFPVFASSATEVEGGRNLTAVIRHLCRHDAVRQSGFAGRRIAANTFSAAFLEHAIRNSSIPARTLLDAYRRLTRMNAPAEVRSTMTLRFAMTLVNFWRGAYEERELRTVADDLQRCINESDPSKSPRLTRDLFFTRARLLENLGNLDNQSLIEACRAYESGLALVTLAHECLARARALGDLANVLSKLAQRGLFPHYEVIEHRYEEALSLLPDGLAPANSGVIESNFAVFLMDRPDGDRAAHTERALALAQAAINHLAPRDDSPHWVASALAIAHLTLGNVLRQRAYGGRRERLGAAREALISGRKHAPKDSPVAGLLRMNQGFVAAELYYLDGDRMFLDEAERCLKDATTSLTPDPIASAVASFAHAMLTMKELPAESLERADAAIDVLQAASAHRETSWRLELLASQAYHRGDSRKARELLLRSLAAYEALPDLKGIHNAERGLAALLLKSDAHDALEEARERLARAVSIADRLWSSATTLEQQMGLAEMLTAHGELAWVLHRLGAAPSAVAWHAHLAKNLQVASLSRRVVSDRAVRAMREALSAEALIWEAQYNPGATESTFASKSELTRIANAERVRARLLGAMPASFDQKELETVLATLKSSPGRKTTFVDLTVTEWGTLVVRHDERGSAVFELPELKEAALRPVLLEVARRYDSWKSGHAALRSALAGEWQKSLEAALAFLSQVLERVIADAVNPGPGRDLVIIPGVLGGIPFMAIPFDGLHLMEHFESITLSPTMFVGGATPAVPTRLGRAVCILSDGDPERARLSHSADETLAVASSLASHVEHVLVIAAVGDRVGPSALGPEADTLPANVAIADYRPSTTAVVAGLVDADFIFYSGHGHPAGLCLISQDGRQREELRLDDVLALQLLKAPTVLLSACSTAHESGLYGGDAYSLASWFLRAGASFVVGGLWEVRDQWSATFSRRFVEELWSTGDLRTAYGRALRAVRVELPEDVLAWSPFVALAAR